MFRKIGLFLIFFIVFLQGCSNIDSDDISKNNNKKCNEVFVYNVIDGDTFSIGKDQKVRMIGIDAPELSHPDQKLEFFAKQSTQELKRLIEKQQVCLKKDIDKTQENDKYGRLLRYVWKDGKNINAHMIKSGYAQAYTKYSFQYMEDFREYEKNARKQKVGLWNTGNKEDFIEKQNQTTKKEKNCESIGSVICPEKAINHIGEIKTVMFKVNGSHDTGRTIFLNSMKDYKNSKNFTVVIFDNYRDNFSENIEDNLRGKIIKVSGKIEKYNSRAEIILKRKDQMNINNN